MTVNEMISSFLIYYDRITSFSAPGYIDAEKLLFLNNGQDDFIKDRMFGKNFQPPSFEDNQRRVADLRTLTTIGTLTYTSTDINGLRQYTIPTDFMFAIKAFATCTRTAYPIVTSGENIECKFIKSAEIGKFTNTTNNRTHFLRPFLTISGLSAHLIVDRFTTNTALILHYIKKPTALVVDGACSLPTHTHQEIIDIAVRQALQATQDPRWQTSVQEQQIKST